MGKNKKQKVATCDESDNWVLDQSCRIDEQRRECPPEFSVSDDVWLSHMGSASAAASSSTAMQSESLSPGHEVDEETSYNTLHREVGLRTHRALAATATGFEPQRHTTFVCGRPVQVPVAVTSW
jgi:hypothetical protein